MNELWAFLDASMARFADVFRHICALAAANSCQSAVGPRITGNAAGVQGFQLYLSMRRAGVIPCNGGETQGMVLYWPPSFQLPAN
jgi:hypothetical protein